MIYLDSSALLKLVHQERESDALELVVDRASLIGQSALRSLDAIHLASATAIHADLTAFVAYDASLADAAADAGLVTNQLGA